MLSSDSEDDCYGNVAKKLETIKKTYQSADVSKMSPPGGGKNLRGKAKSKTNTNPTSATEEDVNMSINNTDTEDTTLDTIIANNTKTRTRSQAKTRAGPEPPTMRATRSSSRKAEAMAKNNAPGTSTATVAPARETAVASAGPVAPTTSRRGRGGYRGRGGSRGRGNNRSNKPRGRDRPRLFRTVSDLITTSVPVYTIGNCAEYPDTSANQPLFAATPDVEIIEEIENPEENEEVSVKVFWQSLEVFKFKVRKYQKLASVFEFFAKKENVTTNKLLLTYNDAVLSPEDTPASINYNIAKFIDGGVLSQSVTRLATSYDTYYVKDGIKVKFQCQKMKKPYEVLIEPEEQLALAMTQYAEHIDTPLNRLRFYFDGDLVSGKTTAVDLEFEGGECIDVKLCR